MSVQPEQKMRALAKGNRVRTERAQLKREIAELPRGEGCARVAELISRPPDLIGTMTVGELLRSPRYVGKSQVSRWLSTLSIPATKTVASLTANQRERIAATLGVVGLEPVDGVAYGGQRSNGGHPKGKRHLATWVDADLAETLKARAREHGRTLSSELRAILAEAIEEAA